jgi:putative aldouronate transport system substrate-binding protein
VSGSTPFEINVLAVRYGSHGADVYQNDFFKNLEKTTNIKVNWDVRWNADFGEQRSLMLASGDMPEVILGNTGWSYNDHIIPNIEYFPPLENLIAQYMPNLSKIFVDDPTFKARSTYLDGHIYALPTKLPGRPQAGSVYAINQTWLTKLGLKAPTTVDELAQVLKAFVTRDPNGNGIADEVGWYRIAGSSATEFDFGLTQHHGVYGEWVMDTATNKVIYTPTSDKFRTAIQWVASLYADGALFPEYYTMTGDQYYAKGAVTNPQVFGYVLDWTPDATIQGNSKDFVVLPALTAPDGKGYNSWVDNFQLAEFEITTKCKNPEVVMRWADQLYTVDATVQTTFGSFGETTRKESNGSYTLLPLSATPDFLDLGQDTRKWWRALADCGPKYWPDSAVINMDETSGDGYKLALDRLYTPVIRPELTVQTGFSYPDELAEYARIRTDVNTYMLQTVSNWIVAGRVTDAQWTAYVSWMNSHGLPDLITSVQKRSDRYRANMK